MPYRADSIESAVEKGVSLFGVLGEVLARVAWLDSAREVPSKYVSVVSRIAGAE